MKRDEFLATLGIGLAAVCTGCLAGCSKGGDDGGPSPITPPPPPAGVNVTLDLNNDIRSVGESKVVSGIIVVRLAASNEPASFTAVQVACTHEGFPITYSANQGRFVCSNHGSQFSTTGAVQMGPATNNLKKYNIAVSGTTLTITG